MMEVSLEMKIKLIIIIASMLVGSSSAQLAHPNEQKLDHSNVNIALAQLGSEANSLALLRPLHAASGSNSPNLTAEEERTVRIISCFAVMYGNEKELLKSADL